jgi:serine/threonine-protein kinase
VPQAQETNGGPIHADQIEPGSGYGTVAELLADLDRLRGGYPVAAHSDSWLYRASRFVRRHWGGVLLTLIVGLALVGFVTFCLHRLAEMMSDVGDFHP